MRQEWSTEDLIGSWTLVGNYWHLVKNKSGATRLGFSVLLVLEDPEFHDLVGDIERRAMSPLFWSNINPYGRFRLDMDTRLDLSRERVAG
ncbi:MAG: hypothetical protein DLM55_04540 [Acidimicrobiales bacterium]|nr:MAG: hypothetical protein DLM55_04540 [Acidimicrobiales bacterium]